MYYNEPLPVYHNSLMFFFLTDDFVVIIFLRFFAGNCLCFIKTGTVSLWLVKIFSLQQRSKVMGVFRYFLFYAGLSMGPFNRRNGKRTFLGLQVYLQFFAPSLCHGTHLFFA